MSPRQNNPDFPDPDREPLHEVPAQPDSADAPGSDGHAADKPADPAQEPAPRSPRQSARGRAKRQTVKIGAEPATG
ncbi:hypothetical protein WAE61_17160 [Comamonadaceae bacterium PP-2]